MHQFGRICRQNWQNNIRPIRLSASNVNRLIFLPYIVPTTKSARQHSTEQNAPCKIPATQLETKAHSLGWETIQAQVEPYFSQNWKFSSEAKRKGFLAIGLSRAFSNSFPLTLDDRVGVTCQMLYLSLLIDGKILSWALDTEHVLTAITDQLEKMSFAQMLSYRHRIMQVVFGTVSPDMGTSHEWMLYDTLQTMRTIDKRLANDVARGFCQLLKAMTSQERGSISTLGSYLDFREVDVGRT
jgi:aristolochene synthase